MSVYRALFGEDVFISYSRADASTYAAALANRLADMGFACFLDQWDTQPGQAIPRKVLRALARSSMLVIVGTGAAARSAAVEHEVRSFIGTRRPLVPISFDGALESAAWFTAVAGASVSRESASTLLGDAPSGHVLKRIEQSARFTKRNARQRRFFFSGTAALLLAAGAAAWTSNEAIKSARRAAAESERAEKSAAEARRQEELARASAARAKEQEAIAVQRAAEADERRAEAERQRAEALRQAKLSDSRKLAGEALALQHREPEQALLLAAQALAASDTDASRDALARVLMNARWIRAFAPRRFAGAGDAAFSSDGSLLALVDFPCGRRLTVLDVGTLEPKLVHADRDLSRQKICLAGAGYTSVAFAPGDGSVIASDGAWTDVVVPAGASARVAARLQGTRAINPRDRRVALAVDGGRSVEYKDDARSLLRQLPLDGERAEEVLFTSDGSRLIVRTRDSLLVWNVNQFKRWRFDDDDPPPSLAPLRIRLDTSLGVKRIATDAAASRIAVLSGNTVRIWDLQSGSRIGEIQAGMDFLLESVALWPGRDYLVTGGGGGATGAPTVAVWEISSGHYVGPLLTGIDRKVTSVAFDAAGRHLATVDGKGNLALWDLSAASHLGRAVTLAGGAPSAIAVAPRRTIVALAYPDGRVELLDYEAGRPLAAVPGRLGGSIIALQFNADGRRLLAATADGVVAIWADLKKPPITTVRLPLSGPLTKLVASPDGKFALAVEKSSVGHLLDTSRPESGLAPLRVEDVRQAAFHPVRPYLFHLAPMRLNVRNLKDGSRIGSGSFSGDDYHLLLMRPDGKQLAMIRGWEIFLLQDQALASIMQSAEFVPPGRVLRGHTEPISAAAYSPDSRLLATSALRLAPQASGTQVLENILEPGDRYEIRLWDTDSGAELGSPFTTTRGPIKHLAFGSGGKRLISLDADGSVVVWDVDPRSWEKRALAVIRK